MIGIAALFSIIGFVLIVQQIACVWFISQIPPGIGGPAENFVTKIDSPLMLDQARKELNFPLPDEASDIYYAQYRQLFAYEYKIKFNAPVEVCKSHALLLIRQYNQKNPNRTIPLEFSEISESTQLMQEYTYPPLNIIWFDLQNIQNGLTIGSNPMIWIDTDRNLFYYSNSG